MKKERLETLRDFQKAKPRWQNWNSHQGNCSWSDSFYQMAAGDKSGCLSWESSKEWCTCTVCLVNNRYTIPGKEKVHLRSPLTEYHFQIRSHNECLYWMLGSKYSEIKGERKGTCQRRTYRGGFPSSFLFPSICIWTFTRSVGLAKNWPTTPAIIPPITDFLIIKGNAFF